MGLGVRGISISRCEEDEEDEDFFTAEHAKDAESKKRERQFTTV
jgi:hypothetical protein